MTDPRFKLVDVEVKADGDPQAEKAVVHELVHVYSKVKFQEENGFLTRLLTPEHEQDATRHDPVLSDLHDRYTERTLPALGQDIVDRHPGQSEGKIWRAGHNFKFRVEDDVLKLRHTTPALFRALSSPAGVSLKKGLLALAGGAFVAGAVASGGALVAAGVLSLPLFTFGVQHMRSVGNERRMAGFESDQVKVQGGTYEIQLNQKLTPQQQMTSAYATLQHQPEEYHAESMTDYLMVEKRPGLKERDQEMHDYCRSWNIASV